MIIVYNVFPGGPFPFLKAFQGVPILVQGFFNGTCRKTWAFLFVKGPTGRLLAFVSLAFSGPLGMLACGFLGVADSAEQHATLPSLIYC